MSQFNVMLSQKYDSKKHIPKGWYMSEKLDGHRAIFDGKQFVSRTNKIIHAPQWFIEQTPSLNRKLDGELYVGRGKFQLASSILRKHNPIDKEWEQIKYVVFDVMDFYLLAKERIYHIPDKLAIVRTVCDSHEHMYSYYDKIIAEGGEGIMLLNPESRYELRRSPHSIKLKPETEGTGEVIEEEPGKDKYEGMMGALWIKFDLNGVKFKIGTGFTDKDRENPPKIGSKIKFNYTELTDDGKPKCAGYRR